MNTQHTIQGHTSTAKFTMTSEKENGNLFSFLLNAVGGNDQRAFTLVELIVAVAIFTIVSTAVLTSLFSVINASRQQQAKGEAVDSLNFIVDDMMRRIRTGYNFGCGFDSGDDGICSIFSFDASEVGVDASTNQRIAYRAINGRLIRYVNGGSPQTLTGLPLNITELTFRVIGSDSTDDLQTRVQLSITGEVEDTVSGNIQEFSIQTTVAQRLLYPPSD